MVVPEFELKCIKCGEHKTEITMHDDGITITCHKCKIIIKIFRTQS